ncbi:MAG: MmgE/PrpD family protein [Novosphingobium sp.]
MGLSADICTRLARLTPDDFSQATLRAASHVLLDATGVMLGASGMDEVQPFVALGQASGTGPSVMLGTGAACAPGGAALANGAMAHALDYEDAFDRKPGHPNASLVPALIALAQSEGPVSGKRLLAATAIGCELSCRLALALRQDMEVGGWYPPPIYAGLGAAVGAAWLLGLDGVQLQDALSLALCQVTMPGEIKHSRRTVIRAVRESFPAQAAVTSALLARAGVSGFEQPLEGRDGFYALYAGGKFDPADLLDGLGERWWIEQLTFKPWPSCRGTHPFIEMALDLRARHRFAPEDVAEVEVRFDAVQQMLIEPLARKQAPETLIDAKFSIPFAAALALARGRVDLDSFTVQSLSDPQVLRLAGTVSGMLVQGEGWQRGSGGAMAVRLHDGRELSAEVTNARGCPERPLSEQELVAKFVDCAGRAKVPPADPAGLAARILAIASASDAGAVFA